MSELNQNEIEITAFKIKLINLKKKNFPDELIETDYLGIRVGDILRKGAGGTIYKVIGLYRTTVRQGLYDHYLVEGLKVTGNDPKFVKMMKKIKESSNFGVCYIKLIPVMKNYQPIQAKRMNIVSELEQICTSSRKKYWKYDIKSGERSFSYKIQRNQSKKQTIENAILADENKREALGNLYIQHCIPATEESKIVNENTI
jgi:hypothetical protein